jgi:aldehyde reductase
MAKEAASAMIRFTEGKEIPQLALGTWKSEPGKVYDAVKYAILEAGYRHIDCAWIYFNEEEVGKALREVIDSGAVKREDLFITSKLWCTFHSTHLVKPALQKTLTALQLDYLDLYLIHFPIGYEEGGNPFPALEEGDPSKVKASDVDYLDTWKGMEECVNEGLTEFIGVSNFNSEQLKRVIDNCFIKPACNQIESHPYCPNEELIKFCKENDVCVVVYSPLGSPDRPWAQPDDPILMEDEKVKQIAQNREKSVAQVLIRFHLQRGVAVIAKSVTPERIAANMDVWNFELTQDEMDTLLSIETRFRGCRFSWVTDHKYYPFDD